MIYVLLLVVCIILEQYEVVQILHANANTIATNADNNVDADSGWHPVMKSSSSTLTPCRTKETPIMSYHIHYLTNTSDFERFFWSFVKEFNAYFPPQNVQDYYRANWNPVYLDDDDKEEEKDVKKGEIRDDDDILWLLDDDDYDFEFDDYNVDGDILKSNHKGDLFGKGNNAEQTQSYSSTLRRLRKRGLSAKEDKKEQKIDIVDEKFLGQLDQYQCPFGPNTGEFLR